MPLALDTLWWAPHAKLHQQLASNSLSPSDGLKKALEGHFDWLVHHITNFKPPSDESKTKVTGSSSLSVANGRQLKIEANLRNATLQLSQLLCLDEVQAHILLKRWRKETMDRDVQLPKDKDGQVLLGMDALVKLTQEYHWERLALLKVVSAVLLLGEKGAMPPLYHKLVRRLINSGLEEQTHKALRGNLEASALSLPQGGHHPVTLSLGLLPLGGVAALPPALSEVWRRQVEVERAQLVMVLLQLYAAHELPCSADRLRSLLQLLREYVFGGVPGGADVAMAPTDGAPAAPSLEQSMAAMLVLAAMGLERVMKAVSTGVAPTATTLPLLPRLQDLVEEVSHWAAVPAAAPVFLTFSAVLQLLYQMGAISASDASSIADLQRRGQAAGEFPALELLMESEAMRGRSEEGIVLHGVMSTCLSVLTTAFSLSPVTLPGQRWDSVTRLMSRIYAERPLLCQFFWDDSIKLDVPLMALLDESFKYFPAQFGPPVRLLASLACGPPAAAAAGQYLQALPCMACWHDVSDPCIDVDGSEATLLHPLVWDQSPSVSSVRLPEGTYGRVLPLPQAYQEEREGQQLLISWQVACPWGVGQLLLLGRAVQCMLAVEAAALQPAALEPSMVQDLQDTMALLKQLATSDASQVPDLLRADLHLASDSEPPLDLLQLLRRLATALVAAAACPALQPFPLQLLADCLHVMRAVSELQPLRVAEALASIPLFAAAALPDVQMLPLADAATSVGRTDGGGPDELPGLRALQQQAEGPARAHPVTLAFLELVAALLDRGHVGGPMWAYVGHALHVVLATHQVWPFHEAAERWQVAAAALRVVRLAVAAGQRAGDPAAAGGGATGGEGVVAGVVGVEVGRAVKVTEVAAGVLRALCLHADTFLAASVPPPAAALQRMQDELGGVQEVDAVEAALLQLLHLLPISLAAAAHLSNDVPLLSFLSQPAAYGLTPLQTLATYLQHPFSPTPKPGHTLVLRALSACLRTATAPRPGATVQDAPPALLPPPERGGAAALRQLVALFNADAAQAAPEVAVAALELLEVATSDPMLLDALLFPSALESAEASPAPAATPPASAALPAAATGAASGPASTSTAVTTTSTPAAASRKKPPFSALDGLWALLQRSQQLWQQQPALLCATLHALLALWQRPAAAGRPLHLLRQQPKFFQHLTAFIPTQEGAAGPAGGATASSQSTPPPAGAAAGTPGTPGGTPPEEADPWQVQAEAYALDIMTLEAFIAPRSRPASGAAAASTSGTSGVWQVLDTWGPSQLAHLVQRYQRVGVPPADLAALLARLQALELQLLSTAVHGVWPAAVPDQGPPADRIAIAPALRLDARDLIHLVSLGLASLDHLQDAYDGLTSPTPAPDPPAATAPTPAGPDDNPAARLLAAQPLGADLLALCRAVPLSTRVLPYGGEYLVDFGKLERLLGPSLVIELPSIAALLQVAYTAGLAASAADARLAALRSLATLLLVALPRDATLCRRLQPCGPLLAAACGAASAATDGLVASATHPDQQLVRLPWGLPSLQGSWAEAALHASKICLQVSQLWRQSAPQALPPSPALVSSPPAGRPLGLLPGPSRTSPLAGPPVAPSPRSPAPKLEPEWGSVGRQLARPLEAWLSLVPPLVNGATVVAAETQATADALMAALLNTLPPNTPAPNAAPALQSALQSLLPHLCVLCSQPPPASRPALQLLTRIIHAHLPAPDWLPLVQQHLHVIPHIVACIDAVTRLTWSHPPDATKEELAGGGTATLQLALAMAQTPQGAAYLHHRGVTDLLVTFAGHLLSPQGGALGCLPELNAPPATASVTVRESAVEGEMDLAGAYLPQQGVASPLHQQWTTVLSLATAVFSGLSGSSDVQATTMDFLAATELRLLLVCQPPAADPAQPLTLALLSELRRVLFLLLLAARNPGLWHFHLPGSIRSFRVALSSFLTFAALPSTTRGFVPACPPRTAHERALAARPTRIPAVAGWFRACTLGSGTGGGGSTGEQNGNGAAAVPEYCSEYSAALAEGVVQCALDALMFLQATAPKVAEGEAATLGPTWPSKAVLAALEEGGSSVAESLLEVGGTRDTDGDRRQRLVRLVLQVVQAAGQFLDVVGLPADRSKRRALLQRRVALTVQRSSSLPATSSG